MVEGLKTELRVGVESARHLMTDDDDDDDDDDDIVHVAEFIIFQSFSI